MDSGDIKDKLQKMSDYNNILIPEFSYGSLRIDALLVDVHHRWIRGFEIKVKRGDFLQDTKWVEYSKFCSSLSIVCPEGLIKPEEVESPFGLLWMKDQNYCFAEWKKRPKNFQKRNSLAWLYMYTNVIEKELRRLDFENMDLKGRLKQMVSEKETLKTPRKTLEERNNDDRKTL
jgi:hypothetical protein